jgi:hypothetical protein
VAFRKKAYLSLITLQTHLDEWTIAEEKRIEQPLQTVAKKQKKCQINSIHGYQFKSEHQTAIPAIYKMRDWESISHTS